MARGNKGGFDKTDYSMYENGFLVILKGFNYATASYDSRLRAQKVSDITALNLHALNNLRSNK